MSAEPGRQAVLHVLDEDGRPLGTFSCGVAMPFLQETSDLLACARAAGLQLVVLRLLTHRVDEVSGVVHAGYLAEALAPPPPGVLGSPEALVLEGHPLRAEYAQLGGLRRELAWADGQLARRGLVREGHPEQQRTWNLSCVARLRLVDGGLAWLKLVPSFLAHEGRLIHAITSLEARLGVRSNLRLPRLIGWDTGRVLLEPCAGALMWGTSYAEWWPIVVGHLERQLLFRTQVEHLLSAGAIDRRRSAFLAAARALCARDEVLETSSPDVRAGLPALIASLPAVFDELEQCGLPDTLVHGDLTPGNVINGSPGPVLLDWGEVSVGLPLLELPALCRGLGLAERERLHSDVVKWWSAHVPAARVQRALELSPILCELSSALTYQRFLDHIEPLERHFHQDDVAPRLAAAIERARSR